jgi:nicotinamide-nucleotide amidase
MELIEIARQVGETLERKGILVATAESCTGGWIGEALTAIPGSSNWFERGFITYSNLAKREMLGVNPDILKQYGAVSLEVAREMALGALRHSHAQVSLAVTGIAGPGGGSIEKPVGTVCFAWALKDGKLETSRRQFIGDREAVRRQSVVTALAGVLDLLA